jgi:enamine deaminase RidA (YjgF/YER057c/UK114 family)
MKKPDRLGCSLLMPRRTGVSMVHKRIRPFNTKATYPEQKLDNDLAQAVVARGTMVFVRGQVSQDLDTRENLAVGDAEGQARVAMKNVKLLLEEAGSDLSHICRITIYLTDIRFREAVYVEMGKWLKGVHYCSTGLVVTALARPEWLVEIEVTAVIPD